MLCTMMEMEVEMEVEVEVEVEVEIGWAGTMAGKVSQWERWP